MTTKDLPSVENELRTLLAAFDAYRQLPGPERSGETPKKLVQVPLQEFFARGLPGGFRGGDGDRPPNPGAVRRGDMDIVIDDVTKGWHGRSRFLAKGETVQVHMEVASREAWDGKKVTTDLNSLHRSIDDASAAGRSPWTSLVLVGGEWKDAQESIAEFLHNYYHERLSRPRRGAPPFINAAIVPGMYLMGHWMFEEQRQVPLSNTMGIAAWEVAWPAMMEHPLYTGDELVSVRPLALARAFLHRYLRSVAAGRVLPELWSSDAEKRDVVGPIDGADTCAWAERSHCICLEDGAPTRLYHYGPRTYERDPSSTCAKKSAYRFTPKPYQDGIEVARGIQLDVLSEAQRLELALTYLQLGNVALSGGEIDKAQIWCEMSLAIHHELGDPPEGLALTCNQLAALALARGELDEAQGWFKKSLALRQELGNRPGMASSYSDLGIVAYTRGELNEAQTWNERSLAIGRGVRRPSADVLDLSSARCCGAGARRAR
jgi:hypothetical protein